MVFFDDERGVRFALCFVLQRSFASRRRANCSPIIQEIQNHSSMTGGERVGHPPPSSIIHHATRLSSRVYVSTYLKEIWFWNIIGVLKFLLKKSKNRRKNHWVLAGSFKKIVVPLRFWRGFLILNCFSRPRTRIGSSSLILTNIKRTRIHGS
jgi:hypothetical protein